jgi:integrase
VGGQGNEPAMSRRRVEPGSTAEVARIGADLIVDALAGTALSAWPVIAIDDVFLIVAMGDVVSPEAAFALSFSYLEHLVESGDYAATTLEKAAVVIGRFVSYLEGRYRLEDVHDISGDHVFSFIAAPPLGSELRVPRPSTESVRWWALDLWFRTLRGLDLYAGDPFLDAERSRRPPSVSRPLVDAEVERARKHAPSYWGDTLGPMRFALAEAMATTSEIASIVVADYDGPGRRLWLPGTPRRLYGRWVPLLPAQIEVIERRIDHLDTRDGLTPLARDHTKPNRGEAISVALRKILVRAGLTRQADPRVKPSSIRAWGGRRLYDETGDLEDVSRCLGLRNLESTRCLIGLALPQADDPPPHRSRR